jgi:hypothetical protein
VEREIETGRINAATADNSADAEIVDVSEQPCHPLSTIDATIIPESQDQSEPAQLYECKWKSCSAEPFGALGGCIEHLKAHHLGAVSCDWSGCGQSMPHSEISRIGHLIDHLNEFMTSGGSSEPAFVHIEPVPRPIEELSVEEAIWKSCSVNNQLKSLSSILLIGGLSQTPGLAESLFHLLTSRSQDLPAPADGTQLPRVEFVGLGKDLDPSYYGWKGGAVSSKLESTLDTWITADEWSSWGVKILRERLPF